MQIKIKEWSIVRKYGYNEDSYPKIIFRKWWYEFNIVIDWGKIMSITEFTEFLNPQSEKKYKRKWESKLASQSVNNNSSLSVTSLPGLLVRTCKHNISLPQSSVVSCRLWDTFYATICPVAFLQNNDWKRYLIHQVAKNMFAIASLKLPLSSFFSSCLHAFHT